MSLETEHWSSPNGCHPDCPRCADEEKQFSEDDWIEDVRDGNTRLGFDDWRAHRIEYQQTERDRILAERAAENRVRDAAPAMLECILDALTMAENLRRETGGATEGAICHTLRAAIALTEPPPQPMPAIDAMHNAGGHEA